MRGQDRHVAYILIVDAEPRIGELLSAIIQAEGHETFLARDVLEAEETLDKQPDGLFANLTTPGEAASERFVELCQHPLLSKTPATFVTAHADRTNPALQAALAGRRVIHAPVSREEVVGALRATLRSRRWRLDARVHIIKEALHVSSADGQRHVAKNLSLGGIFVLSRQKRPIGDQATLTIHHRGVDLETRARVTHSGADGVGYAFVNPSAEFVESLSVAIRDLLSVGAAVGDRRTAARYPVNAAIAFSDGKERTLAQLANLSATGAYVQTTDPPAPGSKVYIYLPGRTFSEGQDVFSEVRGCLCDVVRRARDGFGVHFRNPSAEFQMAVDMLMRQNGLEVRADL